LVSALLLISGLPDALAAGPVGRIQVGSWLGGAYTNDTTGAFSFCAAAQAYGDGVILMLAKTAGGFWLLSVTDRSLKMRKGSGASVDVTFDGQTQLHLLGTATTATSIATPFPDNAVAAFRKSHMMLAVADSHPSQFELVASDKIVATIENCVKRINDGGLSAAGDFSVASENVTPAGKTGAPAAAAHMVTTTTPNPPAPVPEPPGPPQLVGVSGTGFLISGVGHIVTNNHVIRDCVGDVHGNFVGGPPLKLRVVAADETNDLALLQAKGAKKNFKNSAKLRDTPVQSGEAVVAIGFPYHGLLTSDFTVTTGTVSSRSGILNDTRFLQITAPVQPGNSGGPLLDMSGRVVGVVSAKLNSLKFAKATGDIPENVNFAIKTGTVKDFLDNSAISYQAEQPAGQMKPEDIAIAARGYTVLLTCTATVKEPGRH
jgi:S1-C subfamily serine protease